MSNTFVIKGGVSLNGSVTPIPNKNAILKIIPASLLTQEPVICKAFPETTDVISMLEIAQKLGVSISREGKDIKLTASTLTTSDVDDGLGNKIRASILFVGPLLTRLGRARIPLPGGCTLGKRSIASHIEAFTKAGVDISFSDNHVTFTSPIKKRTDPLDIWFTETSVTATENLLMYLSGVEAQTTLVNAACEPHVVQLCKFLVELGVSIEGIGSNKLIITGTSTFKGATFVPEPDFVDMGGFIVAAAITRGKIRVINGGHRHISGGLINVFLKFGIDLTVEGFDLLIDGTKDLEIDVLNSGFPMADQDMPKLNPGPWPAFPVDVLPVVVTLATRTKGRLLVNNWMYESGLRFVYNLKDLGALIDVLDPQKIIVHGPCKYVGGEVTTPDVIQGCKAVFLAALADDVTTTIHGVDILKRRYPDILSVYRSLGANIETD